MAYSWKVIAPGTERYFTVLKKAKEWARKWSWAQIIDGYGYVRYTQRGCRLERN